MRIVIPDDHQDCVRGLDCFARLAGHEVRVFNDTVKGTDALAARFADADAIVLTRERTRIDAELLDRLPRLRLISQTGKLAGHVDLEACTARGVVVAEGSGAGSATAEIAWALALASRRHLVSEANRLRQGLWQGHLGQQLCGQRLGVWSYGRIGRQVAGYGRAFGMQVWIWGREASTAAARADGFELAPTREDFFAQSDVISLHVRLNPETTGIVTGDDLARMKPTALLVNTSRAELIAPGALALALARGRPGFAAVDVYEEEPVLGAHHPLLALPNVLCTPHIGYVEKDNYERYFGIAFDNIVAFAQGRLTQVVNPAALSRAA
ncbi:D-2-hydroxyacid dehydrogenase family protein [Hydrogenophaga sp. PBL-H3]|uniref:D-2-hydroxyacid dehydrogenase family protein n=1 Tax=Hydrogenophaga sp. PBL-H3 TaxID=434010 RepID=UPI001320312A|nr:D-2-hydroxyacid dehydrogenase family protein [Hydrogenophaga sp. PBL-H3]QHE74912.1 D-2-hydroxyacid dehydrogenase family protein [Hydrogenophaga sp. PBL-H3]QHE79339.1 D-2-hydroxyacid dehydrogenase family protein [Hydrogenophaga sp. PBL-H3]